MKFRMSVNVAIPTDRPNEARAFYKEVLGFPIRHLEPKTTEFNASPLSLFVDTEREVGASERADAEAGGPVGPVLELVVDDVQAARDHLVEHGCTIVRWEGPGGDCYIRDPFGVTFNLWQDVPL